MVGTFAVQMLDARGSAADAGIEHVRDEPSGSSSAP